ARRLCHSAGAGGPDRLWRDHGLALDTFFCAVCLVFGFPLTGRWEQALNGGTIFDLFVYPFVLLFLFVGSLDNFDQQFWWHNHHAVVVSDDNVSWLHGSATASNGAVHLPWDVTATQNGRVVAVGIDRQTNCERGGGVPGAPVGDDSICAAYFGTHGQDISESSGTFFSAGFHDHNVILLD